MVTNGLVVNYPLDGSFNSYRFSPNGLKVLYQSQSNQANGYDFGGWLANNGAIMTQSTDLTTVTVATAQTYDLILADFSVWGVSSAIISQLKTFVDAGVSCVAVGNDTRTNVFVASYDATTQEAHDIILTADYPAYTSQMVYKGSGSSDVIGGITGLQSGARPLYVRSDVTNKIMGYWYESTSGSILYFDQEGQQAALPDFIQNMILFAAQRTNAQVTSSNVVWTESAASISRTSSNLIQTKAGADAFFDTSTGWSLVNNSSYTSAIDYYPGPVYGLRKALRVTDNDGNTSTNSWGGISMPNITGLTAQNYTMSIRYKVVGWTTGQVAIWSHQQDSTGVNADTSDDYPLPSSTFDGEWHVYSSTKAQKSGYDTRTITIGMNVTNLGCTIYVDAIQFETGGFLTSFVNGSGGDTKLQIAHGITSGSYTMHFDYYHQDLSSFANNMVIASSYNGSNTGNWFGLNASTNTINNFGSPASPTNQWNSAIFTYDGTTTTFYLNGVQTGTYTGNYFFNSTDMLSFSSMVGWNVDTYLASWMIRNYALYSRVVTAAEIRKIAKPSFSVKKDGSIAVSNVREMPNNIAGAAYYFPLTINGNDTTGQIVPSTDNNNVYTKDGTYIDKGTTNQAPNPTGSSGVAPASEAWDVNLHRDALSVSNWTDGYNGGVDTPSVGYHAKWVYEGMDGGPCMKMMDLNSAYTNSSGTALTHRWMGISSSNLGTGTSLGWASGSTITISWLQKTDTPGKGANVGIYHKLISTGGTSFGNSLIQVNAKRTAVWERVSTTFTIDSDWDLSQSYNYIYVYGYYGPEGILWVDDVQVEMSTFPTGFTNGNRSASLLKYPLNFTPNMSFSFWHKLNNDLASITSQSTSPNLLEVGDYYSNSSFTLWYWGGSSGLRIYARQDGATGWTIGGATVSGTFDQNYWNKWHNYTVVFNGSGSGITGVTLYIDGTSRYTNTSLTISSWSGSFFGFGSYNGAQPNAIYRDLIYTPTALSATDALNLYNKQMKAYKDNRLRVQSKLIEGQVM